MFTTERLILRAPEPSDASHLHTRENDLSYQLRMSPDPPKPRCHQELSDRFSTMMKDDSIRFIACIFLKSDPSAFVGVVSLRFIGSDKNRDALLAIGLTTSMQGKGYGTEVLNFMVDWAFTMAGMHRVSLEVFEGNDNAIKLYQKIGFKNEGVRRKSNWVRGFWQDVIIMGILESEWDMENGCAKQ